MGGSNNFDYILYSDGGGEVSSTAGAACIVETVSSGARTKLVAFLGGATNNEAEITASLLGFSLIRNLQQESDNEKISIKWVSDSEYTLKSATEYINNWQRNGWKTAAKKAVKNQGLWHAYLSLRSDFEIVTQHVRGHTGHPENEACDSAATWVRECGENELDNSAEGRSFSVSAGELDQDWVLVDGRKFLNQLRNAALFSEELCFELRNRLSDLI